MSFLEVLNIVVKLAFSFGALLTMYFIFIFLRYSFLKGEKIIKGKKHCMGVIWSFLYLLLISFYLLTLFLWDEPFSFLLLPIIILGFLAKGSSYFVKDGFVRESFIFYKWERIKNIDITDERVTVKWKGCVFSGGQ